MDQLNKVPQKIIQFLKKNKFVLLLIVIGVVLLLLPSSSAKSESTENHQPEETLSDTDYAESIEKKLEELLSMVDGAGQVRVMLTLQSGCRTEYHSDVQTTTDKSDEKEQTSEQRKTVILSEGSAYDKAAISAVEYPQFQGALVLCEGAERSAVKLNLIHAVSALTGLSSSQITVVKMK